MSNNYDYDLVVIGGGSGGLQCSKVAAELGAKVAVLDYVKPSVRGSRWGLGGTCVNVGCIPKKLMHTAGIIGEKIEDSIDFGWTYVGAPNDEGSTAEAKEKVRKERAKNFNWETLVMNVQAHIKSLNFKYRVDLRSKNVTYLNALGEFVDAHTLQITDAKGVKKNITADKFVVAVGGRPVYPTDVPGALEYGITSDDIFSLKKSPGKSLMIGASYVSLECAGFLNAIGFDTTVMIRSMPLRGFDRECSEMVTDDLAKRGVRVLRPYSPTKVEKQENGQLLVSFLNNETGEVGSDVFETVLFAVGRQADTEKLGLDKVGVKINSKTGKIIVNNSEQTSVPNIYAIGDVIEGGLELTPVAIQAGKLLAERLYNGATKLMDYINVPTTVFTPLEYGACGLPEEVAKQKYGEDDIVIYSKMSNVLEFEVPHREEQAFTKLVCVKSLNEKVVGFHFCGPNAGEVTQAVGIALKLGATKEHFDDTVGIHPTNAETMTTLKAGVTQDSGC